VHKNTKEPVRRFGNTYIRFREAASPVIRSSRNTPVLLKLFPKNLNPTPLLVLLLLKEYLDKDYRDIVELRDPLITPLDLNWVPHSRGS
jgi:hypothetical protein